MTETLVPRPANGSAGVSSVKFDITGYAPHETITFGQPMPEAIPRTRKIAILGFAETVRDAPVNDPSWELWAMNGFHRAAEKDFGITVPETRYSAWFDMHSLTYTREYGKAANIEGQQESWLRQPHPFPIYSIEAIEGCPSVVPYPVDAMVAEYGRDYFTSTIAYALALALAQTDVAEVGLWGVDLVHDTEYGDQRPCAEFYLGWALAKGIKVTVHEKSALLKQRGRYGFDSGNPLVEEIRNMLRTDAASLIKKINEDDEVVAMAEARRRSNDGALQMVKHINSRLDIWERGGRL